MKIQHIHTKSEMYAFIVLSSKIKLKKEKKKNYRKIITNNNWQDKILIGLITPTTKKKHERKLKIVYNLDFLQLVWI